VRLAIPNSHSAIDLSRKFGILPSKAVALVRKVRAAAKNFGICFHVGSQCMDPAQYRTAIMIAKDVVEKAKVKLDVLDIGGGFPSSYPGMTPPNMQSYFDEIFDAISQLNLDPSCRLWCEPGRALVAEAGSLLVRVEGKKDKMLYLNDGTYGGLFDAGVPNFIYPTNCYRIKGRTPLSSSNSAFGFYGPTCDSLDTMKGPFQLPENIAEGDYIEIGQLGAYSRSIRTEFNGFDKNLQIEVSDEPLVSMYKENEEQSESEVIAA
jgi:ornithine decarboxylase